MTLTRAMAVAALVGCLGCGHAKTTDATSPSTPDKAEERTPPADHPDRVAAPRAEGTRRDNPAETSGIPVASSPEGLLAPGAEAQIRDKLADGGYLDKNDKGDKDSSLESGLRKFQKARDLPQTGVPNHETIQALGLDPGRIFKHADVGK
ncbi:MAG TPA: peptidoglycan-binding domain-containing protein [Polyangia bacterium]|nr:peptidoglycan-binding domain-containing protein [Polyangia bacterium]